jgi:hypothetical protein
MMYDQQ